MSLQPLEKESDKRGRKSILDKRIISSMYDQIRLGVPPGRACAIVGISTSVYYKWLAQAREDISKAENDTQLLDDNLFVELMDTIAKAEGELIAEGMAAIKKEGPAGWKWMLARLFRKEFGEQQHITGDLGSVQLTFDVPGLAQPKQPELLEENTELIDTKDHG